MLPLQHGECLELLILATTLSFLFHISIEYDVLQLWEKKRIQLFTENFLETKSLL